SKSLAALRAGLGEAKGEVLDQLPFKSQNRYSAVRVREGEEHSLALGAFEALAPLLTDRAGPESAWRELAATGWRLLLSAGVAEAPRPPCAGALDGYRLRPLALVALSDELRAEAAGVLERLAGQGISFKILSGDNPETVRATVAPLGEKADSAALKALAS